jgi:hypothetical protein
MRRDHWRFVHFSILLLFFGAIPAAAVTVVPGQGVSLDQIDFTFTGATLLNSSSGEIVVDVAVLKAQTGLSSGFVNVTTSLGWVVQNLPVFPGYPYPSISTSFSLCSVAGANVTSLQAHVEYLPAPVTSFAGGALTAFPVGNVEFNAEGEGGAAAAIAPPPPPGAVSFQAGGLVEHRFQPGHPALQTAHNQSIPAAIATSLQWLENTYGTKVPQPNNPGLGTDANHDGRADDGTLVGQLDVEVGRPFVSRTNGSAAGTADGLSGKLRYVGRNGLANALLVKHMGDLGGGPVSETVPGPDGNNVTVTSTGLGAMVTAAALLQEIRSGEDVELGFLYVNGGGHRVEVVGAGRILGVPWVAYQSDSKQSNTDNAAQGDQIPDNEGTGQVDFSFLVDTDGDGRLNLLDNQQNANVHSFFSQSPVREVDSFPNTSAIFELSGPFGMDRVRLTGPSTVNVVIGPNGEASDTDGDGLDQVPTEMVQFSLTGTSPVLGNLSVEIRDPGADPFKHSLGEIEESSNATPGILDIPPFAPGGTASSFFDVFFELHVDGPLGSFVLHNRDPKQMHSMISHKPPATGEFYESPSDSIALYDENESQVATLGPGGHHVPKCELVKPSCSSATPISGGIQVTVQDAQSGLFAVDVTELVNATIQPPISFDLGSLQPLTITARKSNPNLSSRLALRLTDACGNVTVCDPVLTLAIREPGKPATETLADLAQAEGKVSLFNGSPGVTTLRIEVNGRNFLAAGLKDGERRTVDISSALQPGNGNAVRLTAQGKPGGTIEVVIHD